jgi:LysM repeat protein
MKSKLGAESKIPKAKANTNRKRAGIIDEDKKVTINALKKNEFALIILGALVLTLVVFFVFTGTSDKKHGTLKQTVSTSVPADFSGIEKRMEAVEKKLAQFSQTGSGSMNSKIAHNLDERLTRLETALSLKFDTLAERLAKLETSVSHLKKQQTAVASSKRAVPVKKIVKKTIKKQNKASIFHTVRKGETLYGISRRYGLSVNELKRLNKIPAGAALKPGERLRLSR